MTYNNNNMDVIERSVEQIEDLRETLFDLIKYHGSVDNIKEWNLFHMNDELFYLQEKLIRHKSKVKTKNKIYVVRNEKSVTNNG